MTTEINLYRSVRAEQFPNGTVLDNKPAPGVLFPDFEPRTLPSGDLREADVTLSEDKVWVMAEGGTSLFDRPNVFPGNAWSSFAIPEGTIVPESLVVRFTGHNKRFKADHYQIESRARMMRTDDYKMALEHFARNAVVRSIELAKQR